jgi:hypothetical protein
MESVRRTTTTITVVRGLVLAGAVGIGLLPARSAAKPFNACRVSTHAAYDSCTAGARSDKALTVGKCANLADAAAMRACRDQAEAEAKDARQSCAEQRKFRMDTCSRFGPAPYSPAIDPANFVTTVDNPYYPLPVGTTWVYEGNTASGLEHNEVTVTHNTRLILGVTCVEVLDTVAVNGELSERTLDWFAQDKDGNVWYFGENSEELAGGLVVDLGGSFTAGVDGAQPGIIMKVHPAIGDFYRQEFLLNEAEDLAEVVSLSESVNVPAGSFDHCLETKETEAIDPSALENKFYAAGVGNVLTNDLVTGETLPLIAIKTE